MKPLTALLTKELKGLRTIFLFLVLITIAVDLYGFFTGSHSNGRPALSILPFGVLIFLLPAILFYSFNSEWRNNTVYFLFSLPVKRYWIPVLKTIAVLLLSTVLFVISAGGVYANYLRYLSDNVSISTKDFWAFLAIIYFTPQIFLLAAVSLSESAKFSFHRVRGLIATLVFILIVYLFLKLGGVGQRIFGFLPVYHINVISQQANIGTPKIPLSDIVYPLVFSFIVFLLSCLIFEKKVEV